MQTPVQDYQLQVLTHENFSQIFMPRAIQSPQALYLQALLERSSFAEDLVSAAKDAKPGHAKFSTLTSDQRKHLWNWLKNCWSTLPESETKRFVEASNSQTEANLGITCDEAVVGHFVRAFLGQATSSGNGTAAMTEDLAESVPSSKKQRKSKGVTFNKFHCKYQQRIAAQAAEAVHRKCPEQKDALQYLHLLCTELEKKHPGLQAELQLMLSRQSSAPCYCEPLLAALSDMKEKFKHHTLSADIGFGKALDKVVCSSGWKKRKALVQRGYNISRYAFCLATKTVSPGRRRPGRPSKVKDPKWHSRVKKLVDFYSYDSSSTCVVKRRSQGETLRERRKCRTVSSTPSAIWRAGSWPQSGRDGLPFKQFRRIWRTMLPEYKKGRRRTDLCDHCMVFEKKIKPRTAEFLTRVHTELEALCPGYFAPLIALKDYATVFTTDDLTSSLELLAPVLWRLHERWFPAVRKAAKPQWKLLHAEGMLRKEMLEHLRIQKAYMSGISWRPRRSKIA